MRRWLVLLGAASVVFSVSIGPVRAAAATAMVRVAHFSPDTGGVDVYVDGGFVVGNVSYRTVSDYVSLPAGSHSLALRAAGSPPNSPPAVASTAVLEGGHAYTVAGVGPNAQLRGVIFDDDLSAPAAGAAKVRVVNAAVDTGPVQVKFRGQPTAFPQTDFPGASQYVAVSPGLYDVDVLAAASGSTLGDAPQVTFGSGITYTLATIGGVGQPVRVLPLVDARAAAVIPQGPAATGGGGSAPMISREPLTLVSLGVVLCGVALLAARRRTRRR